MTAPFHARYRSTCRSCFEPIVVDDLVRYNDDDDVVHVTCTERPGRADPPVCPSCWLTHAGECP